MKDGYRPKGGSGAPSNPPSRGSVVQPPIKAKKAKLIKLLMRSQYKPEPSETTCRGCVTLGTDCGHCGKCKWIAKRASILNIQG